MKYLLILLTMVTFYLISPSIRMISYSVSSYNSDICSQSNTAGSAICKSSNQNSNTNPINSRIADVVTIISEIAGIIAVITIIIAGIRYSLSGGDVNKVRAARNQLIYTVAGLLVIVSADIILSFVFGKLVL